MLDAWLALQDVLFRAYESTRVRTFAPAPGRIALLHPAEAASPLELARDAVQSFFPGAELICLTRHDPTPRDPIDLALWLHPRPRAEANLLAAFAALRAAHRGLPARRHWFVQRDFEVWSAHAAARATRALLTPLRRVVEARVGPGLARRWQAQVEPHLPPSGGPLPQGPAAPPCTHARAVRVLRHPRRLFFCPDCASGFAPPPPAEALGAAIEARYDAAYALGGRLIGNAEFARQAEARSLQVLGMLRRLGFPARHPAPGRVLDFGCGNGRLVPLWRDCGWQYVGADPSAANIQFCRTHWPVRPTFAAEFHHRPPQPAALRALAPFDAICLAHVLEHVPDPPALLQGVQTLVRPGGTLFVEVPNALTHTWRLAAGGVFNSEHYWEFSPTHLHQLVHAAGWQQVELRTYPDPVREPYLALLARRAD